MARGHQIRVPSNEVTVVVAGLHTARHQSGRRLTLSLTALPKCKAPGLQVKYPTHNTTGEVCLLVGCLMSQQHASVSQGRICIDNFTCCHTEIEVADQTFHLTQSQYTDTGPTSPRADPITPGAWQGSHLSANV